MQVIIFTYEREKMLKTLLGELAGLDVLIIDDGSEWTKEEILTRDTETLIRTHHEGKKGFWKKWIIAQQIALTSKHEYFLFLPDDINDLDLDTIKLLTKQGWEKKLFALNLSNDGQFFRWGGYTTGAYPFEINEYTFKECGYVDGLFLTNRTTLERFDITKPPLHWWDREDKSSGVGYYLTQNLRQQGATMYKPNYGFCFHGKHESKMHGEHRKGTPLISKRKPQ